MPITVITTPADPTANSYAAVTDVDDYALASAYAAPWAALTDAQVKAAFVVRACRTLEAQTHFVGIKATNTQAREWPRMFVLNQSAFFYLASEIPAVVIEAQCALAVWLASLPAGSADPFGLDSVAQLEEMAIGPVRLRFRGNVSAAGFTYFGDVIAPILERGMTITTGSRLVR